MKIAFADREIERHGISSEKTFSIKATGKAFRILSSNLYRDKVGAVIRELSCNAADAHTAAGCPDKPFHVHLPNALEPYFSVRDEGIGLSHEDMQTIYTTYFQSTKTDSNDYIGALGLGSKSPFSYVDSFAVSSCHESVSRTYAAVINEAGEPSLILLSERPTNESNGIEVKLPVKNGNDCAEFRNKAVTILSRFRVRPVVTGSGEFQFADREPILAGNGWRVFDEGYNRYDCATAIMGNVAYRVATSATGNFESDLLNIFCNSVDIEIDFPIGSLDVTAGREDLSYDKDTLAALAARAREVRDELSVQCQARFDVCGSRYEAHELYDRLLGGGGPVSRLLGDGFKPVFRGDVIVSSYIRVKMEDHPGVIVDMYASNSRKYASTMYSHPADFVVVRCEKNCLMVVDDLGGPAAARRINERRRTNDHETLLVVSGTDSAARERFRDAFDGIRCMLVSELPKPAAKKSNKVRHRAMLLTEMARNNATALNMQAWRDTVVEQPEAGGLYVARRGHFVVDEKGESRADFLNMISLAQAAGILKKDQPIYGFDKKTRLEILPSGDWCDVYDVVRDSLNDIISDATTGDAVAARNELAALYRTDFATMQNSYLLTCISRALADDSHPFSVWAREVKEAIKSENLQSIVALCGVFGLVAARSGDKSLPERWTLLCRRYPLLVAVCRHRIECSTDHLVGYIRWCDSNISLAHAA